jgi:hypothetical protein
MSMKPKLTRLPHRTLLLAGVVAVLLGSCAPADTPRQYLFLGHPYDWGDPHRVDPRLERLDYGAYHQIWLGGDVCARAGTAPGNLEYLDRLFDFRRTHWALGNHDYYGFGDPDAILEYLGRPAFYAAWVDGFCLLVLNTNLFFFYDAAPPQENCAEKAAQLDLIRQVTDTIRQASHLIILHHHGLFNELKLDEQGAVIEAFNVNSRHIYATCDGNSELGTAVYPRLAAVQQRGVQVVLIGGDVGMQAKAFEYQTPEGIWLLGSGINNSVSREHAPEYVKDFSPDQVLRLAYYPASRRLEWEFVLLD